MKKTIIEELANGMRVVMRPSSGAPVTAFQVWVGVGSADERPGEEGIAHVLEHMLFKGTDKRAVGEIARDVERAGGQINAWTSYDETVYYITLADRFWEQGVEILADAVQHSALDAGELSRELQVILEEIRMGEDSPDQVLVQDLFGAAYRRHPYGRPIIGYERTVSGFTRRKVHGFYRRWYVPQNMILSIAGNFNPDTMLRKVKALFDEGSVRSRSIIRKRVDEPLPRRPRFAASVKPVAEARFALAFPIPGLSHEDVPALDLLAGVLGQGMSSRLEQKLRREMQLVTDIRAMAYTPRDAGIFAVFGTCAHHLLVKALDAVLSELSLDAVSTISAAELKKAKTLLEADALYSEETVDGKARKSGFYLMHADDVAFEEKYLQAAAGADETALKEAAAKYLVGSRATVSVVIPDPARRPPERRVPWIVGAGRNRRFEVPPLRDRVVKRLGEFGKRGALSLRSAKGNVTVSFTLSNGDLLLVRPDASARIAAARAAFEGGLRFESKKEAGLYSLMASSLVRGTTEASAEEVAALMDTLACSISGFSGRNTFGVQGEFLCSNFMEGFALMAACLRSPAFSENEVELERQLQIEDIQQSEDNPSKQAFKRCYENLFGAHPYSRMAQGTVETVKGIRTDALHRMLRRTTGPGRMVLSVVGGVDPDAVRAMAEAVLVSDAPSAPPLKPPGSWKPPRTPRQTALSLPKEQSHIVIGFPGTTLTAADRFAVEVLTEILGGHGGRLFQRVREEQGLAYSVTAVSMEGIEPGYAALYAGTSPGKESAVVAAMRAEIAEICKQKVSRDELMRVKRHLIGARAISLQRTAARAAAMALDCLYGNGHDAAERYPAQIDAVTAADVTAAARRYLDLHSSVTVCVGPDAEKLPKF